MEKTADVLPVSGVRLATAAAGLRYRGRDDVALIELCPGAAAAAVFTRSRFKAAPVVIAQEHLSSAAPRYLLVNAGIANAGLGAQGVADAKHCCKTLAAQAGVATEAVLPFSTGVIGQRMPTGKVEKVIPELLQSLSEATCADGWEDVARAIMTTDTVPKLATRLCGEADSPVTITGVAKGAGMICPDMATMLAFVATDVELDAAQKLLVETCATSFNAITVDGDTSSNDACVLIATGRSGVAFSALDERGRTEFKRALSEVMQELAQAIVKDAEGASRFITIEVEGAADTHAARTVAMTVANSPLVKTALSAGDPNWGRILAAIGRAPVEVAVEDVDFYFGVGDGEVQVVSNGALASAYEEARGVSALGEHDVTIRIVLNAGTATARVWTSDLTADYVRINADYRN